MSDDVWKDDPTVVAWAKHVIDDMVPALEDSVVTVSLCPPKDADGMVGDVKYWVELGASICLDKPIMVVVMGDAELPERLERVADEIVRLPEGVNLASSDTLAVAIKDFAAGHAPDPDQ